MSYAEPGLRAGWEPDTPVEDTAIRRFITNWIGASAAPVTAMGGELRTDDTFAAANLGRPAGFFNSATLQAPLGVDTVDPTMAAINGFYAGTSPGDVLLFSAWPTPDLREHGWQLEGHPPVMLRAPGPPATAPRSADLDVTEVGDATALRAFEEVAVRGYPLDGTDPRPGGFVDEAVLAEGRMRCWVGWHGGQPVGAAAAFVDAGINGVTLVATLPEHRRRGFGEALTWPATLADPELPAMLLSSDPGRPLYERMGYVSLLRFTVWHRRFGESSE
jgi:GNAT superfamily N-acetyltransferase